jgi:cob(I)alamin adenosyltransferase
MRDNLRKIYTRGGDLGQTRLLNGETVAKDDLRVSAYGTLDELQSHLGVARAMAGQERIRSILAAVQEILFVAGSELASPRPTLGRLKRRIAAEDVQGLEKWIDELTSVYGLPDRFVVPGASVESGVLHVARSVCRRCERSIVRLNRESEGDYAQCVVFFNRLSDLLFVLAWAAELRALVCQVLRELIPGGGAA